MSRVEPPDARPTEVPSGKPASPVVLEGRGREASPYPDYTVAKGKGKILRQHLKEAWIP
ncbi:hypothetical protein JW935_26765 [candidate division KSB1 bacterium]|nr:hypothetical protein [candidate division KSB1 bacterium]